MLMSHDAFKPLKVSYVKAVAKGLSELNGESPSYTEYEKYSFGVMKRIVEIETVLDGLNIGMCYLNEVDLELSCFKFSKVCVYHVENIVSRLTTVEERVKLLVSTSLLKKNIKVASFKGKQQFDVLLNDFPLIEKEMKQLSDVVSKYKSLRNEIAHEHSFSSSSVVIVSALEDTDIEIPVEHSEMKNEILFSIRAEYSNLIFEIDSSVKSVILSLSEVYAGLMKET